MKIIRDARVAEKIGAKSRATAWRKAKSDPDFPKPIKISGGITGWIEAEVDAYLERRVAAPRAKAAAAPQAAPPALRDFIAGQVREPRGVPAKAVL